MKKLLTTAALALPLVGAIVTGVAVANTGYPQQVLETRTLGLLQKVNYVEKGSPILSRVSPVIAVREYNVRIGMEPVLIARSDD